MKSGHIILEGDPNGTLYWQIRKTTYSKAFQNFRLMDFYASARPILGSHDNFF